MGSSGIIRVHGTLALAESHSSQNEGSVHRCHPCPCLCWLCSFLRGMQRRSRRTPGEVDLRRLNCRADRNPHLPSLPPGCRCRCLRGGSFPVVGWHGNVPLPRFHWSRRCLRATWSLQEGEEPAR